MSDAHLEAKLAKYHAAGPPDDLRDRVLTTPARDTRADWMSIAALLFIIVVLQVLAAGERASVRARLGDAAARERLVGELAERLGGDEFAVQAARTLAETSTLARRRRMMRTRWPFLFLLGLLLVVAARYSVGLRRSVAARSRAGPNRITGRADSDATSGVDDDGRRGNGGKPLLSRRCRAR